MCIVCQITGVPGVAENVLVAGYIDPGSGIIFGSSLPAMLGVAVTLLSSGFLFFRKKIIQHKVIAFFILLLVILGTIGGMRSLLRKTAQSSKKVVVLGFDGLDPKVLEEGFQKKLLPNFTMLKETGYYSRLATVVPAESPVAWASFITGTNPAKHGVYDFITRDPATYKLDLVYAKNQKKLLQSPALWESLTKKSIPAKVLFLPDTYPPTPLFGSMLSGMGVPDILGTESTFTLFTTKPLTPDYRFRGKVVSLAQGDTMTTNIPGPRYAFLKETRTAQITLTITNAGDRKRLTLSVQNQPITLGVGEFSDWVKLEFTVDVFTKIHGIAKFYVKSIEPDVQIYLTPINIDPMQPVFPVSYPTNFSKETAKKLGLYSTLGLPHDTWALEEDILSEDTFLRLVETTENERRKIYSDTLKSFHNGLLIAYFGVTDTIQHMFWRFLKDPNSPYRDTILAYYEKMDAIVGKTLLSLKPGDTLIVLSDHGFDGMEYEVNLNTWLKDNGYLALTDNREIGRELLEDVDWKRTKAYAIGYTGIFFNMIGREAQGMLREDERGKLQQEIIERLMTLTNPDTGAKLIKHIYTRKELGISPTDTRAPDLVVGYLKGARGSWDTAVGGVPEEVVRTRKSKWSGDHLFDPTEVPGVLFVNKKISGKQNPSILDLAPSIFKLFDIPASQSMDGKSIQ